ncbi:MAG: phosphonoacetaldehyde hydrolase [Planctomycetia bacterium]|nr:phosphonoacetaldehyde hydrolase [Planctomycetia bacterium]
MSLEIKLVVFDWAGTTIDFGCMAPAGAFVASFASKGVAVTIAEARAPMGLHKKDHIREMLRTESVCAKWRDAVGRAWDEQDVEELYRDVIPRQLEAISSSSTLVPGVRECVTHLRAHGIKIAASTGYFHAAENAVLAAGKRQGYVPDFNICADDVPAGRPAPWMIFRCMEALNVYPPAAVVKVGDTVIDIEDGHNAGVWSVGVIDSSNEMGLTADAFAALSEPEKKARREAISQRYTAANAHGTIDSLAELPTLIAEFNARLARGERP